MNHSTHKQPRGARAFNFCNGLMLAMFLFSVAVQYNDPDPLVWMTVYGLAALACVLAWRRPAVAMAPAALGAACLFWVATLAPQVLGRVGFGELFAAWEMQDTRVEVGRELGGLLIVTIWMAVLFYRARRWRLTAA